jgi:hypothetical protein
MEADAREEFVQRAGYVSREMPAVAAFAGAETGRAAALLLGETSADEGSAWPSRRVRGRWERMGRSNRRSD